MDLLDTVDTEDETPLSSRIRVTHVDTRHRWNRVVTGRVLAVSSPGPREFVCSVAEANGTGFVFCLPETQRSPAVVAGAGAADGANPLLRHPHLSCPLGGSFSS